MDAAMSGKQCCYERMTRRYLCRSGIEEYLLSLTAEARQKIYPFVTSNDKLDDTCGVELMKHFCLFESVSCLFRSVKSSEV
jgi:hypothetical protein